MTTPEQSGKNLMGSDNTARVYRHKMITSFGIFLVFFIFYMGTAILQTPQFKEFAAIETMGMPLGLFLSLGVFPVSWILIIVYFKIGR